MEIIIMHGYPIKTVHQTRGDNFVNSYGFSKFFHCWKEKYISNRIYIILPNILSVCCRSTYLAKVKVVAYLEENANKNVACSDF